MDRFIRSRYIQTLDPVKDHLEISRLVAYYEFPWDTVRSLEFALFRTFAVPSIGELLHASQMFEKGTQKRYDDTDLILSEILEHGYDSDRGRAVLKRLNHIHGHFNISNEDFLYVLTTFVIEPFRWNQRFGWRKVSQIEKDASVELWKQIGMRMGITEIPGTFDGFMVYNTRYEADHFKFSEGSRKVALATENLFLSWLLPSWLYWLGRPFLHAIMDEPLLRAFGFSPVPWPLKALVDHTMKVRAALLRALPTRTSPKYRTARKNIPTYRKDYTLSELGTTPGEHVAEKWLKPLPAKQEEGASNQTPDG